jgi:hypothetical protein
MIGPGRDVLIKPGNFPNIRKTALLCKRGGTMTGFGDYVDSEQVAEYDFFHGLETEGLSLTRYVPALCSRPCSAGFL